MLTVTLENATVAAYCLSQEFIDWRRRNTQDEEHLQHRLDSLERELINIADTIKRTKAMERDELIWRPEIKFDLSNNIVVKIGFYKQYCPRM